jgi:GT2 family glycosyltransferase
MAQKNYPQLRIIRNKTNGGFAQGYNEALAQIDSEYFILLNSDVEVTPGLARTVNFFNG